MRPHRPHGKHQRKRLPASLVTCAASIEILAQHGFTWMKNSPMVFVLGDSRTGTTSLHKFLLDAGFRSIHYFVDEVASISRRRGNSRIDYHSFKVFIEESGFDAFSDYPTRNFFRELRQDYPDAFFILTTRKDIQTWQKSMRRFFASRIDVLDNMGKLSALYQNINEEIRTLHKASEHFIEICIDDPSDMNEHLLSTFLGSRADIRLMKLNSTN